MYRKKICESRCKNGIPCYENDSSEQARMMIMKLNGDDFYHSVDLMLINPLVPLNLILIAHTISSVKNNTKKRFGSPQPGAAMDKRQCSLASCFAGQEREYQKLNGLPGMRVLHDVFFQENAWVDTRVAVYLLQST